MPQPVLRVALVAGVAAAAAALAFRPAAEPVRALDHGDSANARLNPQLDLCDLYVFASPENPARTIFVLTVCPLAGITGPETFAVKSTYSVNVDLDGDFVEEDVHSFTFAAPGADGRQAVSVTHRGRGGRYRTKGTTGAPFLTASGSRVTCGVFDDPAFVDALGVRAGNQFGAQTARNFFRGTNVLGIVLDVANAEFGPHEGFRVWAATAKGAKQVDRVGRPGTAALLLAPPLRDAFNAGKPKDDRKNFRQDVQNRVVTLRAGNMTGVTELVDAIVPDVLPYEPGDPAGLADGNGRRLDEDAVDLTFDLLSDGRITTDHVANDSVFSATFPFLAPANP